MPRPEPARAARRSRIAPAVTEDCSHRGGSPPTANRRGSGSTRNASRPAHRMRPSKAAGAATVTRWPARARATPRPRYGSTSPRDPRVKMEIRSPRLPVTAEGCAPGIVRSGSISPVGGIGRLAVRWEYDFYGLVDRLERSLDEEDGGLGLGVSLGARAQLPIQLVVHPEIV